MPVALGVGRASFCVDCDRPLVYVANPTLEDAFPVRSRSGGHEFAQVGWLRCGQTRIGGA